jgi:hypothetical protein
MHKELTGNWIRLLKILNKEVIYLKTYFFILALVTTFYLAVTLVKAQTLTPTQTLAPVPTSATSPSPTGTINVLPSGAPQTGFAGGN